MAGKLVTNPIQINDSATATNNFVLKADNAGGVKLSRGNDGGAQVDGLSIDASGRVTPLTLGNYANDGAASSGGGPAGALYRNGSVVMVRVA